MTANKIGPHRDKDPVKDGYRHYGRDEFYNPIISEWLHALRDLIGEKVFGDAEFSSPGLQNRVSFVN